MATQSGSAVVDPKRRALGKGLESLLPPRPAVVPAIDASVAGAPLEIQVGEIDRNPYQTRTNFDEEKLKELAKSIEAMGVVQPIVVKALKGGRYQLIAGERRLMASKLAGKPTIPAIVREVSDEQAMEMTIIENLQREDLNPMEQARAFHRLSTDFKMTQEQMAFRTGKDRATVANFIRMLKLPDEVQAAIESGALSFGHAKILLALDNREQMSRVAQKVGALSMSVRQTESFVRGILSPEAKPSRLELEKQAEAARDPNVGAAETRLRQALGLRVKIEDTRGKGRVVIEYGSVEDFDRLLEMLGDRTNS